MAEWTAEWPTERGLYWFYGDAHAKEMRDETDDREMLLVEVWANATSIMYIAGGQFLYKQSCGKFVRWMPAILPEPPTE